MSADSDVFLWRSAHSRDGRSTSIRMELLADECPVLGEGVRVLRQLYRLTDADGLKSGWSNHGDIFIGC